MRILSWDGTVERIRSKDGLQTVRRRHVVTFIVSSSKVCKDKSQVQKTSIQSFTSAFAHAIFGLESFLRIYSAIFSVMIPSSFRVGTGGAGWERS